MKNGNKRPEKKSEEFKRFEDFARRLMAVPKNEIDKKKAEYERKKAKRKVA